MKIFKKDKDGGEHSKVTGYWLVELKSMFSIVLLRFDDGSREAYHTHAFNCFSWVLRGELYEEFLDFSRPRTHLPSWLPFITRRADFHKVTGCGTSWVLSFRGPWSDTWQEYANQTLMTLTHGRKVVV